MRISATAALLRAANRISFKEGACVLALTLLMVGLWCRVYHINSFASWSVPRAYGGDSLWYLGMIKAYRDGEITPWALQMVRSLNAPFSANWNDYPMSEKMLPYCVGIFARWVGLMPAYNLAGLTATVLAAIAFYVTCRILNYQWMFSFVGAAMFGFSHYISARFLFHMSLSYYWHIPFCLLITWWCFDSRGLAFGSSRWWFAAVVGALTGLQAIYYAFIFWQFLGFAIVGQALRRNARKVVSIVSVGGISVGFAVLMSLPHVFYRILHGSNTVVVQRSLSNLQAFGLQLPELFLPPFHRWKALFNFGQTHYFQVSLIRGEMGSPYLGIVGIAGFVWLMGFGIVRLLQGKPQLIPVMFWQSLWIIVFSLIGGVNLLIGVAGLQLFRGTNRFSIVLLCLALLFLIRQLGRICPRQYRLILAGVMLLVGLWDILPPFWGKETLRATQEVVAEDREFVEQLERVVPAGTMVFQAPVMDFPEVPPHLAIEDYTYLRPYLYSRRLRFSYGSDKGRPLEAWQHDVENLPTREMAYKLERYGFGVLLIDRNGYRDGAASLLEELQSSGRRVIEQGATGEFVAIRLQPRVPVLAPDIPPFPGTGFYGWEGDWRRGAQSWSEGNATLILTNDSRQAIEKQYTFVLGSPSRRRVAIIAPNEEKVVELVPGKAAQVGPFALQLAPGQTPIRFDTDSPAVSAGGADPRQIAFSVALLPEPSREPFPILGSGFYGWEGDWDKGAHTWSRGQATLVLNNPLPKTMKEQYTFVLNTTSKRHVTVITPVGSKTVALNGGSAATVGPFELELAPGKTLIRFETDRPAVVAGSNDPRRIAFSVSLIPHPDGSTD